MTSIIPLVREASTSEDGQKMTGMTGCVSLKKILLLITTLFFSKSLRKETQRAGWEHILRFLASAPLHGVSSSVAKRLN